MSCRSISLGPTEPIPVGTTTGDSKQSWSFQATMQPRYKFRTRSPISNHLEKIPLQYMEAENGIREQRLPQPFRFRLHVHTSVGKECLSFHGFSSNKLSTLDPSTKRCRFRFTRFFKYDGSSSRFWRIYVVTGEEAF